MPDSDLLRLEMRNAWSDQFKCDLWANIWAAPKQKNTTTSEDGINSMMLMLGMTDLSLSHLWWVSESSKYSICIIGALIPTCRVVSACLIGAIEAFISRSLPLIVRRRPRDDFETDLNWIHNREHNSGRNRWWDARVPLFCVTRIFTFTCRSITNEEPAGSLGSFLPLTALELFDFWHSRWFTWDTIERLGISCLFYFLFGYN